MTADDRSAVDAETRLAFYPALDGLRGVVLFVIFLFHLDYTWARGGFLAVSTFYTLSGFLITGLLIAEVERKGRIDFAAFWSRRFRRLMPAALAGLTLIAAFGYFAANPIQLDRLRGDGLSALFYVANWWFIHSGADYADLLGSPSPVQHYWSLNIEEQYYFVYPLLFAFLLGLVGRSRVRIAIALGMLAAASAVWMAHLSGTHVPSTRMYYGTDTRSSELLLGGVLGLVFARRPLPTGRGHQQLLAWLGVLGLIINAWLWNTAEVDSDALYQGGLLLYTLGSVAVITAALLPVGPIRWGLETRWLRYLGRISYGAYVYHWPIFLWLRPDRVGLDGLPLAALRVTLTLALAAASYRFLEEPIRRGRSLLGWRAWLAPPLASLLVACAFMAVTRGIDSDDTISDDLADETRPAEPAAGRIDGPLRIFVVGDSVANDVFMGLHTWAANRDGVKVFNGTTKGCGISRGHRVPRRTRRSRTCDDWEPRFARPIAKHDPDVVIVYTSSWDMVERQLPEWDEPRLIGDPEFNAWTRDEFTAAIDALSSRGARVFWISPLCVTNPILGTPVGVFDPERLRRLRIEILQPVVDANSDRSEILDLYEKICPGGEVIQTVAGISNFRPDGIHFSPRGRRWLGRWVGRRILNATRAGAGSSGGRPETRVQDSNSRAEMNRTESAGATIPRMGGS